MVCAHNGTAALTGLMPARVDYLEASVSLVIATAIAMRIAQYSPVMVPHGDVFAQVGVHERTETDEKGSLKVLERGHNKLLRPICSVSYVRLPGLLFPHLATRAGDQFRHYWDLKRPDI